MSEEKQEAYLFIGGVMDGQWVSVPESARKWVVPIIGFANPPSYHKKDEPLPDDFFKHPEQETYIKYCLDISHYQGTRKLHIFLEESMITKMNWYWDLMCKLVNNYKVIK